MIYGLHRADGLEEPAKSMFKRAVEDLNALPFSTVVVEGRRSIIRQVAYFAQGRVPKHEVNMLRRFADLAPTDSTAIVTYVDGITKRSKHQDGLAIDIAPYDEDKNVILWNAPEGIWLQLGEIARKHGFVWGGDWKTHPAAVLGWDCPHWEAP